MSSKPAKRHHLIPKFYLKKFAQGEKICVQELAGKSYINSIGRAFSVNDFYRTSEKEDTASLEFEEHLSLVESNAAGALRKLEAHKRLGSQDKADIAEFLLAQWGRGEDFRIASNSFNNLALRDMARESEEDEIRFFHELSFGHLLSDQEWALLWVRYKSDEGPNFLSTVANNFSQLQSLTMVENKTLLLIRRWTVLEFKLPLLVSGDRPVVLADLERRSHSVVSLGLANSPQLIFPMNRNMALVLDLVRTKESVKEMTKRLQSVEWAVGNERQCEAINRLIALNSREKIFGHPADSERLMQLGEKLNPISNWVTASDWSEATKRMVKLKDDVVARFRNIPRDEIASILEKYRGSGESSDFMFQDIDI